MEDAMNSSLWRKALAALAVVVMCSWVSTAQDQPVMVVVHWDRIDRISQTTPTLQVVVNPTLQRGTPVHDNAFKAVHDLGADYVRYVPWLPYPKLGVAELDPPISWVANRHSAPRKLGCSLRPRWERTGLRSRIAPLAFRIV